MIYQLTTRFPAEERFGLGSQLRRAAVSTPSNIAEGQARHTIGEFIQFISHAEGSAAEVDTQLHLATELGFLSATETASAISLNDEIRRMLNSLRRRLQETR
jgi:four helix bundle protein